MIVLLSPKWIESDYCRKEYGIFVNEVEDNVDIGEYVAPILAREVAGQIPFLDAAQRKIFHEINERQYKRVLARQFNTLQKDAQSELIEQVADDIVGMVQRLRTIPKSSSRSHRQPRRDPVEFDSQAHNFQRVDFLAAGEVVVGEAVGGGPRPIFAHVSFLPRMYVQVELHPRRVQYTTRTSDLERWGSGRPSQGQRALGKPLSSGVYYIQEWNERNSITVCIDPTDGRSSLGEMPLRPSLEENYLAKIAEARPDIQISGLTARLKVSVDTEGLYFSSSDETVGPSQATAQKLKAVLAVAVEKYRSFEGKLERTIPVAERD